jgi:hypothetical protein
MTAFVWVGIASVALACSIAPASAQSKSDTAATGPLVHRTVTVEREVDAAYGEELRITTGPKGGVKIVTWRQPKIHVEAHIEVDAPTEADLEMLAHTIAIYVDPSPTSVEVTTRGPHDKDWMKGIKNFPKRLLTMPWRIDYVVQVPEYTSLAIGVVDGDTVVEGVNGIISIVNARGDVHLTNISGATQASTGAGNLFVTTPERSWHGGNFGGSCTGDLLFVAPAGFSAELTATAPGGVTLIDSGKPHSLGQDFKDCLGNGGGAVTLLAGAKISIELGPREPEP